MTFPIPQSLKKYYEKRAVFQAVNDLIKVLDGESVPKLSREEAKNYNQALLMAAQVRADFVDLLFRVYDETFGKAETVGEEYFESQRYTTSYIWGNGELGVSYYYGTEDEDMRSNELGVMQETNGKNNTICLWVARFSRREKSTSEPDDIPNSLGGWTIGYMQGKTWYPWYFRTESVDIVKFIENPVPTLDRFRREAIKMVKFLKNTPA